MAKLKALITRLEKILEKNGNIDIGRRTLNGNGVSYETRKANGVDLKIASHKKQKMLRIETW